ncbi:MAG: protein translocase subunit SecD, partial [Bacteroidetes bacterium]
TVTGAEVRRGEYLPDTWEVLIEMNPAAAEPWAALTRAHIGKHLALVLDGRVYSAPRVMSEISGGKLMITGNFSRDEARELAALLQQAPLPLKLRWVSP